MLAIENTIAGSLLHNYELLRESGMTIVGEHKLRIKHSFMCLPDDNWETLTEVNSHPCLLYTSLNVRHIYGGTFLFPITLEIICSWDQYMETILK